MANIEQHTVGAQIGDLRVPEQYAAVLGEFEHLINTDTPTNQILGKLAGILSQVATESVGDTEMHDGGVLSTDRANFEKRFQVDLHKVNTICTAMKELGHKIVLTSGSFDIIHIGHAQYLEAASRYGDFLVVGVDSDEKIKAKKGEHRPVVNEAERLRMLAHLRPVDLLTLKDKDDPHWQLIRVVKPDTLVATEGTYSDDEIATLQNAFVDRVVVLPPQATTSTTARLRRLQISSSSALRDRINSALAGYVNDADDSETLKDIRKTIDTIFDEYEA